MKVADITSAIVSGEVDKEIDQITNCIKFRREAISKLRFREVKVGDRVKITYENLSPKYLIGCTAVVTGKKKTKVTIDLEQSAGRFHKNIRVNPNWVEVL